MIPNAYEGLVNKLYTKTMKGQANWRQTADDNTFLLDFDEFSLTIHYQSCNQEPDWIRLELRDETGNSIDGFWEDESDLTGAYNRLDAIYGGARRKALRIDEAINVITRRLDEDEGCGTEDDDFIPEEKD